MNSRRPIILMLALGIIVIGALSLIPYTLRTVSEHKLPLDAVIFSAPAANSGSLPGSAPQSSAPEPLFDVASWYATHGEEPEAHGVLIESLDGQRVYASHNADIAFNPASLIKLSTSLAALRKLGADYRFQTRVLMDGRTDNGGTLHGRLLVAGGDPTFGDNGANIIANGLRARGIKRVTDGVIVSPDFCFNYSNSPEDSAARLARALRIGNPPTGVTGETTGAPLFIFDSYPLRDVLLYMNAHSSNFVAERIGALIGGPVGVEKFLTEELKLPADEVTIERTSGREHNRMTPRGLVTVLRGLIEEARRQGLEPSDIMPVARDDSGTLRRRLAGTGLEGAVVGKTGTLTAEVDGGMASLAGIVYTKDAGMVLFAILDRGNRIWQSRQMEDQLLADVIHTQAAPQTIASPTPRHLLPPSNLRIEGE